VGKTSVTADRAAKPAENRILERHGIVVVGMESIGPVILAALIQQDPLLIGPHGTGSTSTTLSGIRSPTAPAGSIYIQTPASIWAAQSVFIDEISHCRPEVQNKQE